MSKDGKLVDYPDYDPSGKVPWPPVGEPTIGPTGGRKPETPEKKPYYESYVPDPATPDPSQTDPGAPDIRNPDTRLPDDADLSKLSPDVELKERGE